MTLFQRNSLKFGPPGLRVQVKGFTSAVAGVR
jgi:hypothetical protein